MSRKQQVAAVHSVLKMLLCYPVKNTLMCKAEQFQLSKFLTLLEIELCP